MKLKVSRKPKKPMGMKIGKKPVTSGSVIKKKFKKRRSESSDDSPGLGGLTASTAGWLIKDTRKIESEMTSVAASRKPRAPEFYVPAGERRRIVFCSESPVAAMYRYSIHMGGKRRETFTQNPNPGQDLFGTQLLDVRGRPLRPSLVTFWEVIDLDGFTMNDGTKVQNRRSLWAASFGLSQTIAGQREEMNLTGQVFRVKRLGEVNRPTYQFIALNEPLPKGAIRALREPSLAAKMEEFYAPPSVKEQRRIIQLLQNRQGAEDDE